MGKGNLATILRCTGLALLVVGAFVLAPAAAQAGVCTAGFHGVSIFKSCVSPKNRCATDADCSDSDQCNGIEQCATEENPGSNVVECTITLANPAIHCDNMTLLDASDAILNATGSGASSSTIQLLSDCTSVVSGTCTAGTDLGGATTCTIAPGGQCQFLANYYTTVPTDPSTLNDQATVSVQDTCSGGAQGCSTTPNSVQFTASTDTVSGCSPGTPLNCDDGLFCTDDSCVPATGCAHVPHPCNDSNLCTTDTCNEDTNGCQFTPVVCTQDSNLCTLEACDPTDGVCKSGTPTSCPDDGVACNGPESCDPATGGCVSGPPVTCTDDGNACNGPEHCVEPGGTCESGPAVVCDDPICTACNPTSGLCDLPADPLPASCQNEEICRTPGFWGTHGGTEKSSSVNITDAVLDAFGGTLSVCGTIIDNTDVGNTHSALEAICVSPKGDSRLQLARQLTAAALNCGITNSTGTPGQCAPQDGTAPCAGVSIEDVWNACNAACPTGTTAIVDGHTISCIGAIDCFNNGGVFDPATGNCNDAVGTSCHDRNLVTDCFNFQPPGAAGSPKACNDARKNNVVVVP